MEKAVKHGISLKIFTIVLKRVIRTVSHIHTVLPVKNELSKLR